MRVKGIFARERPAGVGRFLMEKYANKLFEITTIRRALL